MYHSPTNAGKRAASFSPSPALKTRLFFARSSVTDSAHKKLKLISVLKLPKGQKESYPCYHGLFMAVSGFGQVLSRTRETLLYPVLWDFLKVLRISFPVAVAPALRRSLCRRKLKKFLACPSPSGKILSSTGLWASLVPRVKENLTVEKYYYSSWTRSDEVN